LGKFQTLQAYLAAPELVPYWESALFSALKADYTAVNEALNLALERHLPILRLKRAQFSIRSDSVNLAANGKFWSKGIGSPIWLSIANYNGHLSMPPQNVKAT